MVFDEALFMTHLREAARALDAAIEQLEHGEDTGMTEYTRGYTLAQLDGAVSTVEMLLPEFVTGATLRLKEQLEASIDRALPVGEIDTGSLTGG